MEKQKKIRGGWWGKNYLGQKSVIHISCQVPQWDLYRENVKARIRVR